jgi:hypothetical protein
VRDGKSLAGGKGADRIVMRSAITRWSPRARTSPLLIAAALAIAALSTSSAAAAEYGHTTITGEYGRTGPVSPGVPGCVIAFQSAENRLYMMGFEQIYALQWNGAGSVTAIGGEFPISTPINGECYEAGPDFTVDQTNGNIYMSPVYAPHVYGWSKEGVELPNFPVTFSGIEQVYGLATTNTGEPWASDYEAPARIHKSSANGGEFGTIELAQNYVGKIAIDQTNNDLYAEGDFSHVIKQYSAASGYAPTDITYATSPNHQKVAFAVNGSTHTLYVPYDKTVRAYDTTTGELKEEIEVGGETLGVAVDEDTDTLFVDDREHEVIKEFPRALVPKAVTGDPIANTAVSGTVAPNGAGNVVECFFEFGPAAGNYTGKQYCDQPTPITTETAVTATLPGLPFEQATHYRVVAKTASVGGTRRGVDKTITPHAVEGLTTEPPSGVTRTAAQLNASFEGNGEATKYKFQWGVYDAGSPESYESESPLASVGSPTAPPRTPLPLPLTGLTPETTYHYRVVAENSKGLSKGDDVTFQTLPPVQGLTATPATNVGPRTATLNGTFVGDGADTTYHFEYGTEPGFYPNTTPAKVITNSSGVEPLAADISGLELETTYYYRVVATNNLGTTHSHEASFTSRPAVEGVVTLPASGITHEELTLNGEYTGNGHDIRYHFEYGPTGAYGKNTPEIDGGTATGVQKVSATINDFVAYTTYHYRLVAEDTDPSVNGITYGPDETVETEPALLPEISGTRSSSVTPNGATLEAEINPNRWLTVYRFDYGTHLSYGESTEFVGPIDSDATPHAVSAGISGLSPGKLYHYRVVAINFTGTVYGPDQTFLTPDVPFVEGLSVDSVGESTARLSVTVTPNSAPSSVHFEYGATAGYGASTAAAPVGEDAASHAVVADLSGLSPGTTYHFHAVATNQYGTTSSPDQTFTTAGGFRREETPKPTPCRKGFVRRHGKCVKRHHKHRHHHRGHRHG